MILGVIMQWALLALIVVTDWLVSAFLVVTYGLFRWGAKILLALLVLAGLGILAYHAGVMVA